MFRKLLSVILLIGLSFTQFDWDDNGLPLRQGIHTEWQRTASIGNDGEVIFVWSDTRDGGRDIFAQKVNLEGEILWQENGTPIVTEVGRQEDPVAVSDENGGIFLIWRDYKNEPEHGDVYAQHVLSDGSLNWDSAGIPLSIVEGTQESLNMCSDGLGGVFVIWNDKSQTSSSSGYTYGTHISASGEIVGAGTGVPIISSPGAHTSVSFETSGQGYASLVWEDAREPGEIDIYTQRIDSNCNTLWGDDDGGGIPVCTISGIDQNKAKVNYISENRTVIVWEDERNGVNNNDIFLQIIDELGNKLLENDGLNICSNEFEQFNPRIKTDSDVIYIVWEDKRNDAEDVFAQAYSVDNGILWEENGKSIVAIDGKQTQPRLTGDGFGGVFFTWMDERNAVHPQIEIYLQKVDADGNLGFQTNGIAISEAINYQFNPIVRKDNLGGAFVVFGDQQTGSIDMAVQHIDDAGTSFEDNGKIVYTGLDGDAISPKLLYLGNNRSLAYWKDMRNGGSTPQTYGQIITSNFTEFSGLNGQLLCENEYQDYPSATLVGENIFLNFLYEEDGGTKTLYYIVLDQDLNPIMDPNGLPIFENEWNLDQFNIAVTSGYDDFLYVAYSDMALWDYDVKLQKYDNLGNPLWENGGVVVSDMGGDDLVQSIKPRIGGGCIVFYEKNDDDTGLDIYAQAIDSEGNYPEDWVSNPLVVSDEIGDQTALKTQRVDEGIFMSWKDTRNQTDADIYGQFISDEGQVQGPENGLGIVTKVNDQLNPSFDYDNNHNLFMLCWEDFENGMNYDIFCTEIDMEDGMQVDDEVLLAGGVGDQLSPFVFFKKLWYMNGVERFMFVWEDSRLGVGTDIYYQEADYTDNLIFEDGGIVICDEDFSQHSPRIEMYSEEDQSYVILWEDLRSSGKEDLRNTYVQSRSFYENIDIDEQNLVNVSDFRIKEIYPNPFNPITTINFTVPMEKSVSLQIYNLNGQLVETLVDKIVRVGFHSVVWNADNFASGFYFVKLVSGSFNQTQKILLIK